MVTDLDWPTVLQPPRRHYDNLMMKLGPLTEHWWRGGGELFPATSVTFSPVVTWRDVAWLVGIWPPRPVTSDPVTVTIDDWPRYWYGPRYDTLPGGEPSPPAMTPGPLVTDDIVTGDDPGSVTDDGELTLVLIILTTGHLTVTVMTVVDGITFIDGTTFIRYSPVYLKVLTYICYRPDPGDVRYFGKYERLQVTPVGVTSPGDGKPHWPIGILTVTGIVMTWRWRTLLARKLILIVTVMLVSDWNDGDIPNCCCWWLEHCLCWR